MKEKDYTKDFIEYGIPFEPLPNNYDPNEFGKQLISAFYLGDGVIYASSTSPCQTKIEEND